MPPIPAQDKTRRFERTQDDIEAITFKSSRAMLFRRNCRVLKQIKICKIRILLGHPYLIKQYTKIIRRVRQRWTNRKIVVTDA